MIHLHGMVSAGMFTLLLSQPHALSESSKACIKHCLVMSRPLQLCTSEKLRVSHGMAVLIFQWRDLRSHPMWYWLRHREVGMLWAVVWQVCDELLRAEGSLDWDTLEFMVQDSLWLQIWLIWGFSHLYLRCLYHHPSMFIGGRCCAVRGISFLYFHSLSCRPRNVQ